MNEIGEPDGDLIAARGELLGVVLAGGRSSRMGRDKAKLTIRGSFPGPPGSLNATSAEAAGFNPPLPEPPAPEGAGEELTFLELAVNRLRAVVAQVAVSGRSAADLDGWGTLAAGKLTDTKLTGEDLVGEKFAAGVLAIADTRPGEGPASGVWESLRLADSLGMSAVLITPVDMPDLGTAELLQLVRAWSVGGGIVCGEFAAGRPEPLVAIYPVTELAGIERLTRSEHRSLSRYLSRRPHLVVPLSATAARNVNTPGDWG